MEIDFNKKIFDLIGNSEDLQAGLLHKLAASEGYSIPTIRRTGGIKVTVFERDEEDPNKELELRLIHTARGMTVEQLDDMLAELRAYLCVKAATGEPLSPAENTLKDIDITALAVYALSRWALFEYRKDASA